MLQTCECNLTLGRLKERISGLQAELRGKNDIIMELSSVASTQMKHLVALRSSGCGSLCMAGDDPTLPWPGSAIVGSSSPVTVPGPVLAIPNDQWSLLGAKPKLAATVNKGDGQFPLSSTPVKPINWLTARKGKHCGRPRTPPTPQRLELGNRFEVMSLQEFPSMANGSSSPPRFQPRPVGHGSPVDRDTTTALARATTSYPSAVPIPAASSSSAVTSLPAAASYAAAVSSPPVAGVSQTSRRSNTGENRRRMLQDAIIRRSEGSTRRPAQPTQLCRSGPRASTLQANDPARPSPGCSAAQQGRAAELQCLLIGSSMVRQVLLPRAETFCYPGAQVSHINSVLPHIIHSNPAASMVVTHIGSNDLKSEKSESLKTDFKALIDSVLTAGKQCIVSGPMPSPRFGDIKFSRARQLHVWLKQYCLSMGIPFVDNFNVFWNRPSFFASDGLHLNKQGKHLLASNMLLTIKSVPSVTPLANSVQHD